MARQTRSRYGWGWALVLLGGLAWLSIGCSPQTLSMLVMPFNDNKVDPDYKIFASDKEVTVVILSNFSGSENFFKEEIRKADTELADQATQFFRKRCEENKHKFKLIPQAQVRSYQMRKLAEGDPDPVDVGRHFKADYVLHLEIDAFGLYEKRSYPKMFRGHADINVNLYKVKTKSGDDDEHLVFGPKHYMPEYPKEPIAAEGGNPAQFRRMFLAKAGREITRMFIAFPPEEKRDSID